MIGDYKIEGLYLKLGKKLTLRSEKVIIPASKEKPSFENIDKTFDNIKYLFTFFDYIDIRNIMFENNRMNFIFTDDILFLTSDDYEIAGTIHRSGQILRADVSMLHLKKEDITLKGDLSYDLKYHTLSTEGDFDAYNIKGRFLAKKKKDDVQFTISSESFTDLKTLIRTFNLRKSVESWITDRVYAEQYQLQRLEGHGTIAKDGGLKIDFDSLEGTLLFDNVKIFYQETLDPVLAKGLKLRYAKRALYFDLDAPVYKQRSLGGSSIAMTGLGGSTKTTLKLDLHMHTPIDDEVHKILKSYAITLPVKHKGKDADIVLQMDIPLGKKHERSSVYVTVDVNDSMLWYQNVKIPVANAHVTFDNQKKENIAVDATLKKGTVDISKTKLAVLGGKGHYAKGIVRLDDVDVKESWYAGKLNGKINIKKKNAKLEFNAKSIQIGEKEKFIILKNKRLPLNLEYSKNLHINLPSLAVTITNRAKDMRIEINDITKIKPYLHNIDIEVEGGKLDIVKKNDLYTFTGELRRKACFFYDKSDVCHTRIPCSGSIKKGILNFYAFDKRLHYNSAKSRIKLNKINIDLKKFLDSKEKRKGKKGHSKKLVILGKKSKIRYEDHALLTDSYDIEISPKGNIQASGSLDGDIVQFTKKSGLFSVKAYRVKDKMLHPLINFNGLKKGRYSIKISGDPDKVMKGHVIVEGGIMSDFKAYNNTLAFINAIPALATLSNPGFSEKGFKIQEGVVDYRMIGDKIIFDSVYIKGPSATIVGKGEVNVKAQTIKVKLAIQTARELGKFVGNLPLLGYILMGKDKSMTVGLEITGSLNKPKVKTSAAKEILSLPLEIIKRTLESPGHIINQ